MNEGKQLTERKDERISVLVKVIHLYAFLYPRAKRWDARGAKRSGRTL